MSMAHTYALFASEKLEVARQHSALQAIPYVAEPYDHARWAMLLLPDDYSIESSLHPETYRAISTVTPILRLVDQEDYGWSYQIYADGELAALCYEQFHILSGLVQKTWAETDIQLPEEEMEKLVAQTAEYQEAIRDQYARKNTVAFRLLGVDDETIHTIDQAIVKRFSDKASQADDQLSDAELLLLSDAARREYFKKRSEQWRQHELETMPIHIIQQQLQAEYLYSFEDWPGELRYRLFTTVWKQHFGERPPGLLTCRVYNMRQERFDALLADVAGGQMTVAALVANYKTHG